MTAAGPALRVGGVILCGGQSRRMGMPKALLPFGDELMLQRMVRLLSAVVQPMVVVAAADQSLPPLPAGVLIARDDRREQGPLEGLRVGLTALAPRADAAYATSCDAPLLVPDFVRSVIDALGDHDVAVPQDGKFRHPLAAVYRCSVVPVIQSLVDAGQLRPAFLFDRVNTKKIAVDQLRAADPELLTLRNLNEPADYFAALEVAGIEADPQIRHRLVR